MMKRMIVHVRRLFHVIDVDGAHIRSAGGFRYFHHLRWIFGSRIERNGAYFCCRCHHWCCQILHITFLNLNERLRVIATWLKLSFGGHIRYQRQKSQIIPVNHFSETINILNKRVNVVRYATRILDDINQAISPSIVHMGEYSLACYNEHSWKVTCIWHNL